MELLRLCAFLDSDDIDLDILSAGRAETGEVLASVLGNQMGRAEAAGALAETSLVTVPAEGHLRVHRLVQAVTRDQLDDHHAAEWAKRALDLIAAMLPPDPADYRSWPAYAKLAPHIQAVAGHVSSYPDLKDKLSLLKNLGIYLSASGQLRAARTTCERALEIAEALYDPDHPEVAKRLGNLGAVQAQLGELGEALTNVEGALVGLKKAHGPDDPEVAKALGNLGVIQQGLGELRDARTSFEHALAIFQAALGPDDPEVAKTFSHLGVVQWAMGEQREAFTNVERAQAIYVTAYGSDDPAYASTLMILGVFQLRLWKPRDALTSLKRAVPILLAVDDRYQRHPAETKIDWSLIKPLIKRQKIFGFVYLGLVLYATVRTGWPTARGRARRTR